MPQTNAGTLRNRTETTVVAHPRERLETSRRHVDDDAGLPPADRQDAALERPRDQRDRAVPAGGRVAGVVEEDDAEIRAVVLRLGDEAAVHVGMAARLVDKQLPKVIEPLGRVAALREDRVAAQLLPVTMRNGSPPVW